MWRQPCVYMLASRAYGTLYIGVTSNLVKRIWEHKTDVVLNAQTMANTFIEGGVKIVSGGTDNHLFLVDLIDKGITGKDLDAALGRAQITVNKNAVPTWTPDAPRANAAATPRPSAIPPAATTGVSPAISKMAATIDRVPM